MKKYLLLSFAIFVSFSTFGQEPNSSISTFVLQINGEEYLLDEGDELKLDSLASTAVISVKLADYRNFSNDFISFDYPSNFSY